MKNSLYARKIKGSSNNVVNILSGEFKDSKYELADSLYAIFNDPMPPSFQIKDLPIEITSWIVLLLERLTTIEELKSSSLKSPTQI